MFRDLLTERFKLSSHHEMKEAQGYELQVAKNGSKMKAAVAGQQHPMPEYLPVNPDPLEGRILLTAEGPGVQAITGRGVLISQLVEMLSETLEAFVLDQTGIAGKYYFGFKFQGVKGANVVGEAPSIFAALRDELGLRLESQKGSVELLVVDHMEKPSDN